ncbi:MAG TPA: hypothetical protein VIM79_16735 [Niastella sp.]
MFKPSIFTVAFLILTSCGTSVDNEKDKQTPADILQNTDSTSLLLVNLKKSYPSFEPKPDSSLVDTIHYSKVYYPDVKDCHSFSFNRVFLGKLNMAKAKVVEYGSSKRGYLQTGNIKLWVCNLPMQVKSGDTVFITGLIYDKFGNEKTWGYPTILSCIRTRSVQRPLSKS